MTDTPIDLSLCSIDELTKEILNRQSARSLGLVLAQTLPPEHHAREEGDTLFVIAGDYSEIARLTKSLVKVIAQREPSFVLNLISYLMGEKDED